MFNLENIFHEIFVKTFYLKLYPRKLKTNHLKPQHIYLSFLVIFIMILVHKQYWFSFFIKLMYLIYKLETYKY